MNTVDKLIRAREEFLRRVPRSPEERRAYDTGMTDALYIAESVNDVAERLEARLRKADNDEDNE